MTKKPKKKAKGKTAPNTTAVEPPKLKPIPLKTLGDVGEASAWVFNQVRDGRIDAKTADAMNTTLKGLYYMKGKLPMDYLKLVYQAKVKKLDMPLELLQLEVSKAV